MTTDIEATVVGQETAIAAAEEAPPACWSRADTGSHPRSGSHVVHAWVNCWPASPANSRRNSFPFLRDGRTECVGAQ